MKRFSKFPLIDPLFSCFLAASAFIALLFISEKDNSNKKMNTVSKKSIFSFSLTDKFRTISVGFLLLLMVALFFSEDEN